MGQGAGAGAQTYRHTERRTYEGHTHRETCRHIEIEEQTERQTDQTYVKRNNTQIRERILSQMYREQEKMRTNNEGGLMRGGERDSPQVTSPFSLFFALARVYCLMIQTITKSAICLDKVPLPRSISCHLITGSAGSQTATSPPNYKTSVELVRFRSFSFSYLSLYIMSYSFGNYRTKQAIRTIAPLRIDVLFFCASCSC